MTPKCTLFGHPSRRSLGECKAERKETSGDGEDHLVGGRWGEAASFARERYDCCASCHASRFDALLASSRHARSHPA